MKVCKEIVRMRERKSKHTLITNWQLSFQKKKKTTQYNREFWFDKWGFSAKHAKNNREVICSVLLI